MRIYSGQSEMSSVHAAVADANGRKHVRVIGECGEVVNLDHTLVFPPSQDQLVSFTDGMILNFTGPADQTAIIVDSAMNCGFWFPLVVYGGNDKAIHIHPSGNVPIDGFPAWTENRLVVQTIARPNPFQAQPNPAMGLCLDGRGASLVANHIVVDSILNFGTQVKLYGAHRLNELNLIHLHSNWVSKMVDWTEADFRSNWIQIGYGGDGVTVPYPGLPSGNHGVLMSRN